MSSLLIPLNENCGDKRSTPAALDPEILQPVIPGLNGNLEHSGERAALDPRFHGDDKRGRRG
jgi:hypothetical protein